MLKGILVASTPSLPSGGNKWQNWLGGLLGNLDALSPPRILVNLEGDIAVVSERLKSAPLARLQFNSTGEARVIEGDEALARLTAQDSLPVALHLDEDRLLRRDFRLPRTTPQSDLKGAIGFEIERHTPFRADDVTYGWRFETIPGDTREITAQVMITQRQALRPLLAGLWAHNLNVVRLTADLGGNGVALDLPDDLTRSRTGPYRWHRFALLTALVAALISPPLWLQHRAGAITDATNELRGELLASGTADGQAAQGNLFKSLVDLRRHPEAIDTLNRLSATLPDGTWLTALTIDGRDVVIEGISDSNVRLVQLLEASPGFSAVTYAAPVVRNQGNDNERFVFNLARVGR